MPYRRVVIATSEWAAVAWAKRHAKSTFLLHWSEYEGLSVPFDMEVVRKTYDVDSLPIVPEAADGTAAVVFYGRYGYFGKVLRWDEFGVKLPDLQENEYLPPTDIKNISGTYIGHDAPHMLRLKPRKA